MPAIMDALGVDRAGRAAERLLKAKSAWRGRRLARSLIR